MKYYTLESDALAQGPIGLTIGERHVGVFDVDGRICAIDNICPHANAPLSEGYVDGAVVECAWHNARFHIPSGKCLNGPGRDIATYPVQVTGNFIVIDLREKQ